MHAWRRRRGPKKWDQAGLLQLSFQQRPRDLSPAVNWTRAAGGMRKCSTHCVHGRVDCSFHDACPAGESFSFSLFPSSWWGMHVVSPDYFLLGFFFCFNLFNLHFVFNSSVCFDELAVLPLALCSHTRRWFASEQNKHRERERSLSLVA